MTPQEQMTVPLLERGDRSHHLDLFLCGHHNAVLASVRRLDTDDGVREEEIVRAVQSVEVDALAGAVQRCTRPVYFMKVGGIDHIVFMLRVGIRDMAEQDARELFFIAVFILSDALAPSHLQPLVEGDIVVVRVMGGDMEAEHHVAEGRMRGGVHYLHVAEGESQIMFILLPYLYHRLAAVQELPLGGSVPQGVVVHSIEKWHIVVVVVFHDQLCREIGDMLLVHRELLFLIG